MTRLAVRSVVFGASFAVIAACSSESAGPPDDANGPGSSSTSPDGAASVLADGASVNGPNGPNGPDGSDAHSGDGSGGGDGRANDSGGPLPRDAGGDASVGCGAPGKPKGDLQRTTTDGRGTSR